MPWALPAVLRRTILRVGSGKYRGFNDSHLCQKLHSRRDLSVSGRAYAAFCAAKLGSPQKRRPRRYRARRLRRPRFGNDVFHRTPAVMTGWKVAAPNLRSRLAGRRHQPDPLRSFFNSKGKHPRLISVPARHGFRARRAAQPYRDRHGISSATIPTGPWPNNWLENNLPLNRPGSGRTRIQQIPPTLPKPKAASERAWPPPGPPGQRTPPRPRPAISSPPTKSSPASAPTTTSASPSPLAKRKATPFPPPALRSRPLPQLPLSARGRPDHVITFGAHSIALRRCLPNAATPAPPANSPTASMPS